MAIENEQQPTAFCIKEIDNSRILIQNLSSQLPKLRYAYEKYKGTGLKREYDTLQDLQKAVNRLLEEFPALVLQLNEYGDEDLSKTTQRLYGVLKKFNWLAPDYSQLCGALDGFAKNLPTADHNINTAKLAHLMNRARMGYFPTDPAHVQYIKEAIGFPEDSVNLIDPCCGEGIALQIFAEGIQSKTYGIELDEVRAEEAQKRLHRVGFGSFFHSRVSLDAFQGLWLNPPYLSVPSENGSRRLEKSFLADSMRLLQTGGILIYIIPYYRATPDVCRVLCENFTDLRVHRFIGKEFERFKQVAFIGVKTERRVAEKMAKRLSEYMLNPENIPPITKLPKACYTKIGRAHV